MDLITDRLRICEVTTEAPRILKEASVRTQARYKHFGTLWLIQQLSSSLCVWKMMKQEDIWIIKHVSLFWAVDNMAPIKSFYTPKSMCVNQREKLISQKYCCFPRQGISYHKDLILLTFSLGGVGEVYDCVGLVWEHILVWHFSSTETRWNI